MFIFFIFSQQESGLPCQMAFHMLKPPFFISEYATVTCAVGIYYNCSETTLLFIV